MPERHRVLVIAEAANPTFVSVPLVGWSHATAIARHADALIVTQVRNRQAFLDAGLREGEDFVSIDTEWLAGPLYRINKVLRRLGLGWTATTALAALSYYAFDRAAARLFKDDLHTGRFDVVHRVTPLSPTVPSAFLSRVCRRAGVPFVLGPLNGGVPWPKQFRSALRAEGEWLAYLRGVYRLLPGYRDTLRAASAILAGSLDTLKQIPAAYQDKCFYVVENAVDPSRFTSVKADDGGETLNIAFVGRLVPYKGADMMIEAVGPLVAAGRAVVNVYGDGPERGRLEQLAARVAPGGGVRFHGWVPHQDLHRLLSQNDLFVFPSIREFGGGGVLEAMALGVVPVVVDYGGPGELVTPQTGFAVPMGARAEIVQGVRGAVQSVLDNPTLLPPMREAGLQRVAEHFTWDAKARKIVRVYHWVTGKTAQRPDLEPGFRSLEPSIPTPNHAARE